MSTFHKTMNAVLVVCTRRIGDVLLATPVIRSIKQAAPEAVIDMLVFEGTQGIVSANADVRKIWTMREGAGAWEELVLLTKLWRRYDVALSVLAGDRPTFYAWAAGKYRIGMLRAHTKSWWKRHLLDIWVPFDHLSTHTVTMNLRLLEPLGIEPLPAPVVSWRSEDEEEAQRVFPDVHGPRRYAVLHVSPKFSYKAWTPAGWAALGQWLRDRELSVVVAGGALAEEQEYVHSVMQGLPPGSYNLAGRMGLPALGYLLSQAALYIGTDTAVSHMAAAIGTPTVVLFGPSNPVKWGPWPKDFPALSPSPWKTHGSQQRGNVFLIQGEGHCVPCLNEGCEQHIRSLSDCLQHLPAARVVAAAEQLLCQENKLAPGVY